MGVPKEPECLETSTFPWKTARLFSGERPAGTQHVDKADLERRMPPNPRVQMGSGSTPKKKLSMGEGKGEGFKFVACMFL